MVCTSLSSDFDLGTRIKWSRKGCLERRKTKDKVIYRVGLTTFVSVLPIETIEGEGGENVCNSTV